METVSNLASQASKLLFGGNDYDPATQSGQEPRSGETGDVRRGEPYDAGNLDEPDVDNSGAIKPSTPERINGTSDNNNNNIRDTTNYNTSDNMNGDLRDNKQQNDYIAGNLSTNKSSASGNQHESTQSSNGNFRADDVSSGTKGQNIDPTTTTSNTTPGNVTSKEDSYADNYANKIDAQPGGGRSTDRVSDNPPSNAADNTGDRIVGDPSSGNQAKQKQQGADKPMDEPTGKEPDAVREKKQNAEAAANNDASGPSPVPSDNKSGSGGAMGGTGEKPQSESHGEGTGEKYIKSTGVKAEGGDFDAANAGAGREADRLLEEAGIRHESADGKEGTEGKGGSSSPDRQNGEKSPKKGFTEKIKSKFHKH